MSIPRLVLLPGLDGTGDLFDPFVEALAPGTAVKICLRGQNIDFTAAALADSAAMRFTPVLLDTRLSLPHAGREGCA